MIVFLIIFVFFVGLTVGLLICLSNIWCTWRTQRRSSQNNIGVNFCKAFRARVDRLLDPLHCILTTNPSSCDYLILVWFDSFSPSNVNRWCRHRSQKTARVMRTPIDTSRLQGGCVRMFTKFKKRFRFKKCAFDRSYYNGHNIFFFKLCNVSIMIHLLAKKN